jgi:ribosomal protein S18 acetylase RimI-like enzyme
VSEPRQAAVVLRAAADDDRELLLAVYASTRAEELDQVAWAPGAREAFLEMQFAAQDHEYRRHNPDGSFDVVEVDGVPVGRLYVDRRPGELRIVDVALLPAHRGAGIGTRLVERLQAIAAAEGRLVSIHVEVHNPAARLYARLGFSVAEELGVYRRMEWRPVTGSGEGGLVAHPVVGATDRHQEQLQAPERVVLDGVGRLGQERLAGPEEDQRELPPGLAVRPAPAPLAALRRLHEPGAHAGSLARDHVEPLALPALEQLEGEPPLLVHAASLEPARARRSP